MGGVPEPETAVVKMSARGPRPAPDDEPTKVEPAVTGTSIGSPIEALERDEILRTRTFSWLVVVLALVGASAAAVIPGGHPPRSSRGQRAGTRPRISHTRL